MFNGDKLSRNYGCGKSAKWFLPRLMVIFVLLAIVSCGNSSSSNVTKLQPNKPLVGTVKSSNFLPFFDEQNNPINVGFPAGVKVDVTPQAPQLKDFDKSVLQTCGAFGTKLKADSFKQLLSQYPQVLEGIKKAVGGEIYPGRRGDREFLDDLSSIWFKREGFEHIFCGEIERGDKIGGLHYFARYLQLQNQGIGGRLANNERKEEVIPGVVYTVGVEIKQGNRLISSDRKGYPYGSDGEELLVEITKAFKAYKQGEKQCLYLVKDANSGKSYQAVFVQDNNAIVTFYPDATPKMKSCGN